MDEPTNSMDSTHEGHFIEGMRRYKVNRTTIIISHKNLLLSLTHRLILLDKGRVVMDDKIDEVIKQLNKPVIQAHVEAKP